MKPSDLEELGEHLGRIAAERFELESRCERLEQEIERLKNELGQWKSDIVQQYVATFHHRWGSGHAQDGPASGPGGATRQQKHRRQSGSGVIGLLRGGGGGGNKAGLPEEVATTVQAVVEETLLRNIQLQNDVKMLGEECESLMQHTKTLEEMLQSAGTTPPTRIKPSTATALPLSQSPPHH